MSGCIYKRLPCLTLDSKKWDKEIWSGSKHCPLPIIIIYVKAVDPHLQYLKDKVLSWHSLWKRNWIALLLEFTSFKIYFVMCTRGKTLISCTLYINNILCVRVDLSNPKHLHLKQHGIRATNPPLSLILRPPPTDTIIARNHNSTSLAPTTLTQTSDDLDLVAKGILQRQWPSLRSCDTRSMSPNHERGRVLLAGPRATARVFNWGFQPWFDFLLFFNTFWLYG